MRQGAQSALQEPNKKLTVNKAKGQGDNPANHFCCGVFQAGFRNEIECGRGKLGLQQLLFYHSACMSNHRTPTDPPPPPHLYTHTLHQPAGIPISPTHWHPPPTITPQFTHTLTSPTAHRHPPPPHCDPTTSHTHPLCTPTNNHYFVHPLTASTFHTHWHPTHHHPPNHPHTDVSHFAHP